MVLVPDFSIRTIEAKESDICQLYKIDKEAFANGNWTKQAFRRELKRNDALWLVALNKKGLSKKHQIIRLHGYGDDEMPLNTKSDCDNLCARDIIGFCGIWFGLDNNDLVSIAVNSRYRNQGVAKELLNAAFTLLNVNEIAKPILLEVRADNNIAISLYKSLGFETISVRKKYYRLDSCDAIIMQKCF